MGLVWVDSLTILAGDGNYDVWVEKKIESLTNLIQRRGPGNPPMEPPVVLSKELFEEDMAKRRGTWSPSA